jgi:Effector-associated domain 11
MLQIPEYIARIKQLVAQNELSDAVLLLGEMAEQWKHPIIHAEAITLQRRLNDVKLDEINGTSSEQELNLVNNQIARSILLVLQTYEEGGELLKPMTSHKERGRIVHNVPPKMEVNDEMIVSVRIAKDDMILLADFDLPEANKPTDLDISNTMEVSLVDPTGGNVFKIRRITEVGEQAIELDRFTEWDFGITPLQSGKHILFLYAYFITKVDGEKTKRAISFKRPIEITTDPVEDTARVWQPTDMVIKGEETKNRGLLAGGFGLLFKAAAVAAIAVASYFGYTYYNGKQVAVAPIRTEMPSTFEMNNAKDDYLVPVLVMEKSMIVKAVLVNNTPITGWTYQNKNREIHLPAMKPTRYFFKLVGEKQSCSKLINLSADSTRIDLYCFLNTSVENTSPPPIIKKPELAPEPKKETSPTPSPTPSPSTPTPSKPGRQALNS